MNFSVFQGGLVQSPERNQAQYNFFKKGTSELLEQTYRDVVVNSRIAFNTITDGISKVSRQTNYYFRNKILYRKCCHFEVVHYIWLM